MLRKYVRQLNPIQEKYVAPIDKVQSYLTESSLTAADWEQVICVAYNIKGGMSEEDAISAADISNFTPKYQDALPIGIQIVENAFGKSTKGEMKHYGQDAGTISKGWNKYFVELTGKPAQYPTNTPKTDMMLPNANISLKKYGGSQLMSGKGAETLATLGFAYDNTPDSIKTQAFDKAWKQLNNDIAEKWVSFKLPPGGQAGKIASGKQKADPKIKNLIIDTMTNNKAMTRALNEIFETYEVKKEVVREAMTGNAKFSDKNASATHMMKFGADGRGEFVAIDEKLVDKYTNATSFNVSFKTGGTGKAAWTALKGIYKEENEILDDIITESIEETDKEILEEGILSKVTKTLKNWVMKFLKKVWDKIKRFLIKSLNFALNLLGVKMTVSGDGYRFGGF